MPASVKELLAAANAVVPRITADEAAGLIGEADALVVDVRDPSEVAATGKVKGALNVSRGMIEFRADAETPYHDPAFQKDRCIIVYCASGGRSALAGKALKEMGYGQVYNLGAFKDAKEAGLETETA
jgi:rhodanese-related sulfurtransferase